MGITTKSPGIKTQIALFKGMLKSRLIEERMLLLLRKNQISKWFSGIGQEAVSVAATQALKENDFILPMHRNLGVFTERKTPLPKLFAQLFGEVNGFTKARDRSFHFGSKDHHIVGMISHLGAQLPVACGIALGEKLSNSNNVTLAFSGDGGTSEGDFHEALNLAATWNLPIIFLIENNGYSISTPTDQQFKEQDLYLRGIGYGIESIQINGNDAIEVYQTIKSIRKDISKNPRPYLVEAKTFRVRGHEESSGTHYVPKEKIEEWSAKDPIDKLGRSLEKSKVLSQKEIDRWSRSIELEIDEALATSKENLTPVDPKKELEDVYASSDFDYVAASNNTKPIRYVDAINEAQSTALSTYSNLVLMGQDIADYGGVFKATQGLHSLFGSERVRNTPVSESAVIGAGLGLSIKNHKAVIEMQFADFVSCGFNQIVNNLAKSHYRWGQNADVVIRLPYGGGNGGGPYHSQSVESWFYGVAGLKLVFPSTPEDAKGLLLSAVKDPNPVLFFEHKGMYRSLTGPVSKDYYETPIGKGRIAIAGSKLSIITYGMGVQWALAQAEEFKDIEVIDLRSLQPWDKELVFTSVKKTGKAILLTEDSLMGSVINDIGMEIQQNCFEYLDASLRTVGSKNTPIPFNNKLEKDYLADNKLEATINDLLNY